MRTETFDYLEMRGDWYAGADSIARAVQRHIRKRSSCRFINFPKQWIPFFEYFELDWKGSVEPECFVPLISGQNETEILSHVESAKQGGQLRLLVEGIASMHVVLSETLQRIDVLNADQLLTGSGAEVILTNWHSYSRPEVRAFENELLQYEFHQDQILFIPCGKARPYDASPTYRKLMAKLDNWDIPINRCEVVVVTSIGPVPEQLWSQDLVMKYDTGIRDIYRILVLFRRLLHKSSITYAYDCLSFRPYRDLLSILQLEGYFENLVRPKGQNSRNTPNYRLKNAPQ